MKKFNTGYAFIDERVEEIKNNLPKNLQEELNYVLIKTHSLGIHEGLTDGLKMNQNTTVSN